MTVQHTPVRFQTGPLDSRGVPIYCGPEEQEELVAYVEDMQDEDIEKMAAFIVLAVNSHDALLEALQAWIEASHWTTLPDPKDFQLDKATARAWTLSRAAIAAAEGRKA